MEVQLLFLLDYDLRIDEAELVEHFSPFFKKTTLVSSGSTPVAKQQVMKGMSYSASCDDVFTASSGSRGQKKGEMVPLTLSASVPPSVGVPQGATVSVQPSTPEQQREGVKRAIFTRANRAGAIRRPCPGSGASSASDEASCAELTEDHSSSDDYSSATSDEEIRCESEDAALQAKIGLVKIAGIARPRFMGTRSASTTSIVSKATSYPMTPTSSNDSVEAGPSAPYRFGMVKSVSYYEMKSPLAGRDARKASWV